VYFIAFFGASVTQQTKESGYVPQFNNLLLNNNYNFNIIQKGFGSMHLYDAGICKINDVVGENPHVCFIDWFSTGLIVTNQAYLHMLLDCIVRKLMLMNCHVCFLLLDRLDMCENRMLMYTHIIDYAKIYNIHYIELYNNQNVTELLRDTVHTNTQGALLYSSKIYDYFITNILPNDTNYYKIPNENEYSNINCVTINKQVKSIIMLSGNFKLIGIQQQLGPFSGIIEITRNNSEKYTESVWDQWCHFTRDNIKIKTEWSETIAIKILQDTFDTSQCKSDIDFDNIEKYIYVYEIYYLGELLVTNID